MRLLVKRMDLAPSLLSLGDSAISVPIGAAMALESSGSPRVPSRVERTLSLYDFK